MSKITHRIFLFSMVFIVGIVLVALINKGMSYYKISIDQRFFHSSHLLLKPSGTYGHGFGIFGSLLMILGVSLYMVRKRLRSLSRLGNLKYWLEFHIFLCTLGPILVLFHTAFKFGGIVAVSFWSMVAVFLSGIIGRFIYIQIPRSLEGRELSLNEVRNMKNDIGEIIKTTHKLDEQVFNTIISSITKKPELYHSNTFVRYYKKQMDDLKTIKQVKKVLKQNNLSKEESQKVISLIKEDFSLNRKIERLVTMQKLFTYWHVAHLPFAIVMLIIMIIHVAVTLVFGYKWIF